MSYDLDIESLNKEIESKEKIIKVLESLERLNQNVDFKKLIYNFILKDQVLEFNKQLSNFNLTKEERNKVILTLTSLSTLQSYLDSIIISGNLAKDNINDDKLKLSELRQQKMRNIDE